MVSEDQAKLYFWVACYCKICKTCVMTSYRRVNVQQPRKCPGGGEVYWGKGNVHEQRFKEQSADKSRRVLAIPPYEIGRESVHED